MVERHATVSVRGWDYRVRLLTLAELDFVNEILPDAPAKPPADWVFRLLNRTLVDPEPQVLADWPLGLCLDLAAAILECNFGRMAQPYLGGLSRVGSNSGPTATVCDVPGADRLGVTPGASGAG
jgi:hypothetical protein